MKKSCEYSPEEIKEMDIELTNEMLEHELNHSDEKCSDSCRHLTDDVIWQSKEKLEYVNKLIDEDKIKQIKGEK